LPEPSSPSIRHQESVHDSSSHSATASMPDQSRQVRIAIADDHQIFRDGLKRLLESEPGFEVVAEASDGIDAVRMSQDIRPDVLLLDVAMPRMGGLDALAALANNGPRVILLTAAIPPADLLKAIQFGARGVVMKESATRQLIEGIHRVMDGKYIIGTDVADDLAQAVKQVGGGRSRPYKLTARELEIVSAIADGQSNRQIAERLSISLQTVKHHLTSIFDKTGASNRLELALLAIREGVVDTD
jgi:two-component system, NarL family, nitrate/nitrite response regulator NarL